MRGEIDPIVLDFDGVLTDNRVYVFEDGREAVRCTQADVIAAARRVTDASQGVVREIADWFRDGAGDTRSAP